MPYRETWAISLAKLARQQISSKLPRSADSRPADETTCDWVVDPVSMEEIESEIKLSLILPPFAFKVAQAHLLKLRLAAGLVVNLNLVDGGWPVLSLTKHLQARGARFT